MDYFIGGTAVVEMFDGNDLFATARTLLDSTISIDVSSQDVQAGQGHVLRGKYFYGSKFMLKFNDSMFKLEYIAKNIGSAINVGGDAMVIEEVTLGTGGTGTVTTGTPVAFGTYGTVGWAYVKGETTNQVITFTDSDFTFAGGAEDDVVCVKYFHLDSAARKLIVNSNIIPDTIRVVMKAQLFAGDDLATSTKVGNVQIDVPRFIFDGTTEISLTSDGVSTTPLGGSALSVQDVSCEESGYYATITEILTDSNWYDTVTGLSILGGDFDLTNPDTSTLDIRAIAPNVIPFKPPYADLTFTSGTVATATISSAGLVTTVAAGTTLLDVAITSKTTINTNNTLTVS